MQIINEQDIGTRKNGEELSGVRALAPQSEELRCAAELSWALPALEILP